MLNFKFSLEKKLEFGDVESEFLVVLKINIFLTLLDLFKQK